MLLRVFSQNLTIQELLATGHVFCHHAMLSFQNSMTDGRLIFVSQKKYIQEISEHLTDTMNNINEVSL